MRKRKYGYTVMRHWDDYDTEYCKAFSKCIIYPASKEEFKDGGFNLIGHNGSDGFSLDIYDTLKQAILSSGYNPESITFKNLNKREIYEKDTILSQYTWNHVNGYTEKKKQVETKLKDKIKKAFSFCDISDQVLKTINNFSKYNSYVLLVYDDLMEHKTRFFGIIDEEYEKALARAFEILVSNTEYVAKLIIRKVGNTYYNIPTEALNSAATNVRFEEEEL